MIKQFWEEAAQVDRFSGAYVSISDKWRAEEVRMSGALQARMIAIREEFAALVKSAETEYTRKMTELESNHKKHLGSLKRTFEEYKESERNAYQLRRQIVRRRFLELSHYL